MCAACRYKSESRKGAADTGDVLTVSGLFDVRTAAKCWCYHSGSIIFVLLYIAAVMLHASHRNHRHKTNLLQSFGFANQRLR